jgi:hypothetical protein
MAASPRERQRMATKNTRKHKRKRGKANSSFPGSEPGNERESGSLVSFLGLFVFFVAIHPE